VWEVGLDDDPGEHLHQGDLLVDVPLPVLTNRPDGAIKTKERLCMVVSQCCTIERRRVVQVAQVLKTSRLRPESGMYQGLISDWPARPGQLFYDAMRLEPIPGFLDPPEDPTQLWTVDFRVGCTFNQEVDWLRQHFRARMTAVARRNLRMRLGGHYARATTEDRRLLDDGGDWSDLADAPEW